jgi:site-specific recombinase XerD
MNELETKKNNNPITPTISTGSDIDIQINNYLQTLSESTRSAYYNDFKTWIDLTNIDLQNATQQDALLFIKKLGEKGYLNSTINRKIAAISKLCSIYVVLGLRSNNPFQILGNTNKIYKPINNQISLNFCTQDVEIVIANANKRLSLIIKFLVNTGLRISEMTHIKKSDIISYNPDFMRIRITKTKNGKMRVVYIPVELYLEIKKVFNNDSEYLFSKKKDGGILCRNNLYKQIRRAFEKYAQRENIGCHKMRHYFATSHIVDKKTDISAVSKYLGHSNVSTTYIYVHSEITPDNSQVI